MSIDVDRIEIIGRSEMPALAREEYRRLTELLFSLSEDEWAMPTPCGEWNVKQVVAHLVGAGESNASLLEFVTQVVKGYRKARARKSDLVHGLNDVQVEHRQHIPASDLARRLSEISDRAISGRKRTPGFLRSLSIGDGNGGKLSLGHLVDVVYTRDLWMHRLDISTATGRPFVITGEHDGRIIQDIVKEWASTHAEPFDLKLSGPAGGMFYRGKGGLPISIDAVEFCRALSGRSHISFPLAAPVPF